ncbi:hypothetical protein KKB55_06255 [Myxococcota bacterium]|nr:hypothetical protein [Myxococcota bacterium]
MSTVGLLFLSDLYSFAPWISDHGGAYPALGAPSSPTLHPPPGLIVVLPRRYFDRLMGRAAWLRGAARLALVLEPDGAEILEDEWATLGLDNLVGVFEAGADLEKTIDAARACVEGEGAWPIWAPAALRRALPPGQWIAWRPARGARPDEDQAQRAAETLDHALDILPGALCFHDDAPCLLDGIIGARINLLNGATEAIPALRGAADLYHPIAARPDGRGALDQAAFKRHRRPIGVDPSGQIAWAGGRCWFEWFALSASGPVAWTPSSHGWPDGHAKKLYGFEDNEPRRVQLGQGACLSIYQRDALITPGLPLRWRDRGDGLAVAGRARGGPRALLFTHGEAEMLWGADPSKAEEDARGGAPPISLGPSAALRYVVGLEAPTWRLIGGQASARPLGLGGWAVYDEEHREVRRGQDRLWAGWDRWIVVAREGLLWREDLLTGARSPLGAPGRAVQAALPLPGSPNALLISVEVDVAWLRVV